MTRTFYAGVAALALFAGTAAAQDLKFKPGEDARFNWASYDAFAAANDLGGQTVKIFGAERCLFGSNFPIEKLWTTYRKLTNAFLKASDAMSAARRKAIFHDTASRVYRL